MPADPVVITREAAAQMLELFAFAGRRRFIPQAVPDAVQQAERLIDSRQYVLDSDWGQVQPRASDQNAYLERHSWQDYARWHLGLTDGATDETKARYAFVYGDFRRIHRMGIIACLYRAAEWRHKEIELAAHDLLQRLDKLTL